MARSSKTIDRDLGWKKLRAELERAKVSEVVVGILEGEVNDGQSIAEYAAYNEFGTENIPERSFMRSTFDERLTGLKIIMGQQFAKVKRGEKTVHQALSYIGLKHQDQIKDKIGSNMPPPNAPATIEAKGSSKTLIDTGAMKNSVHYLVRGKS